MQGMTKRLLAFAILLSLGVGAAVCLVRWPPWGSPSLEKRLLGRWQGTGTVSEDLIIAHLEIPGGTITTACTVQAEFNPDGTYTWKEQHQGDSLSMELWLPKEEGPPSRWEVVRAQGNKLTVRTHSGEVVFDFQNADAFTMKLPDATKASGTIAFRRAQLLK